MPRNLSSRVSGTGYPNVKLVLVLHPGTETYSPSILKPLAVLLSFPGPEPGTEFSFELPAKFEVGKSKLKVPEHIQRDKRSMVQKKNDFRDGEIKSQM